MGHKFYIGAGVLLALFAAGLLVGWRVGQIQEPVSEDLQQAIQQAEDGDLERAGQSLQQAKARWDTYRNTLATFSDHTPMDKIDELFSQTQAYADAGSGNHFLAGCARLAELLQSLSQEHKLTWWNLICVAYSAPPAP